MQDEWVHETLLCEVVPSKRFAVKKGQLLNPRREIEISH